MDFATFLRGLAIGFGIAAPVGPIGILCIRRTLADGRAVGFASGLGAATADAMYGAVAAFGLTLVSSALVDRRRWLQAVGGLHGQIRRTIWLEALSIGSIGLTLGFILGAIGLFYLLQIVEKDIAGMRLDYQFPYSTVLALVPTILIAAFVAAIWPAESAVHGSLVEALEYE